MWYPGEEHGNPLQYSCLENLMDRGAWGATIHGVAKSRIQLKQLSMHTHMIVSTWEEIGDGKISPRRWHLGDNWRMRGRDHQVKSTRKIIPEKRMEHAKTLKWEWAWLHQGTECCHRTVIQMGDWLDRQESYCSELCSKSKGLNFILRAKKNIETTMKVIPDLHFKRWPYGEYCRVQEGK